MKKALLALGLLMTMGAPSYAQTAGQSVIGFLLAQGQTYGSFTCPATATSPCFVPYGSTIPTGGGGSSSDVNVAKVNGVTTSTGAGATGTGTIRVGVAQDSTTVAGSSSLPAGTNTIGFVNLTGTTIVPSTALEANHVILSGAGKLVSFEVGADSTLSAAAWWIMIYDATSAPVDGAVTPKKCYPMGAGEIRFNGAFNSSPNFTTGIVIGVSTTGCFTKTASAHAFISGDYQ